MDLCVPMSYCIYDAQSYLEAIIYFFFRIKIDLDKLKTKLIYLVTAKSLNCIGSILQFRIIIHPLPLWSIAVSLEIHSFKLILPIHSCPLAPASSQFSFHFQFKFNSVQLENFFLWKKILDVFCHLSFWLLKNISTIPFLAFVIRTFSLKWKSIFRGSNWLVWTGHVHCFGRQAGMSSNVNLL